MSMFPSVTWTEKSGKAVSRCLSYLLNQDLLCEGGGRFAIADLSGDVLDDPDVFHGTPIAVHLMGRKLEEEELLAVAQETQRCLLP